MVHELKIWPVYYSRVEDGSKTFEIRKNDRMFQPGDTVILKEWNPHFDEASFGSTVSPPKAIGYTGRVLGPFIIGYLQSMRYEDVVFSLLRTDQTKSVTDERFRIPPGACI